MEVYLTSDFISRQKQCRRLFLLKSDISSKTLILSWKSDFWLIRPSIMDEFSRFGCLLIIFIVEKKWTNKTDSLKLTWTNIDVCIYTHLNSVAKQYYVLSMDTWLWLCNKTWKERKPIIFQIVVTSEQADWWEVFSGKGKKETIILWSILFKKDWKQIGQTWFCAIILLIFLRILTSHQI